jgi:hypothetical protein
MPVHLLGLVPPGHARGGLVNISAVASKLPQLEVAVCIIVGSELAAYRKCGVASSGSGRGAVVASRPTRGGSALSHPVLKREPNVSHMCARIKFHTYDRRHKCIPETMH